MQVHDAGRSRINFETCGIKPLNLRRRSTTKSLGIESLYRTNALSSAEQAIPGLRYRMSQGGDHGRAGYDYWIFLHRWAVTQ
jgi:hypothetical protein